MSQYLDIPYGDNLKNVQKCLDGFCMKYKVRKRDGIVRVWYTEPIALYWLGCNVVALGAGLFESSLTTHAFHATNNKK